MISVPLGFLDALSSDHTEENTVELWAGREFVMDLNIDGPSSTMTVDGTADTLRYCNLTLADPLVPGLTPDNLWPIGPEIKIFSTMYWPGNNSYKIQQGVYRLSKPNSSITGTEPVVTKLDGYDYSKVIARNRWTKPWQIEADTNVITAIVDIARNRLPNVEFDVIAAPSPILVPETTLEHGGSSNPMKDMKDLGDAAGLDVFFNHEANLVIRAVTDPATTAPVYDYLDDDESITVAMNRAIDEEQGYSGVVLLGSHPDAKPVAAESWDYDALSPTFVNTYGFVPYFIDTQFISDAQLAQPQMMADSKLLQVKGIMEQVTYNAIANFAHEQGDVVSMESEALNVLSTSVLDAFSRNLEPGSPLQATTRKSRVVTS